MRFPSLPSPLYRVAALAVVPLAVVLLAGGLAVADTPTGSATPIVPPQLEPFEPFLDTTWRGLVNPKEKLQDVSRWERALGGQAIRMVHSVGDGAYGGETIVMWDREEESLVYYYFTTAGFYTHGTMWFEDGLLQSREEVTGHESGIREVRSTHQLMPDGRLRVHTRMLQGDAWLDRGEVFYEPAPDAKIILP